MNNNDNLSSKPHFLAHEKNGFSIQFENKIHVSVIWNEFSYSEYGSRVKKGEMQFDDYSKRVSATVEVLVTHEDGHPIRVEGFCQDDDVMPHLTPDNVARLLAKLAAARVEIDMKTVYILS